MNKNLIAIIIIALFLLGCNEDNTNISSSGIVLHKSIENEFYGIVTNGGEHYLPENLSPEYQKDSLRISFEGIITDHATIVMWGRTIKLTKVTRIQ